MKVILIYYTSLSYSILIVLIYIFASDNTFTKSFLVFEKDAYFFARDFFIETADTRLTLSFLRTKRNL